MDDGERWLKNTALLLARHIDQQLDELARIQKDVVESLQAPGISSRQDYERRMSAQSVHLTLKEKADALSFIRGIGLYDADGKLLNFSRDVALPVVQIDDRDYFKTLKSNPQLREVISEPIISRVTGQRTVAFVRKISAPNGDFAGVLVMGLNLAYFESFFSSLALEEGSSIALLRSDGLLLVRFPEIPGAIGRTFLGGPLALKDEESGTFWISGKTDDKDRVLTTMAQLRQRAFGTVETNSIMGTRSRLVAAQRLRDFPLYINVGSDITALLANWWAQTKFIIVVSGGSMVAIAIVVFLIVRRLLRVHTWSMQALMLKKKRLDTAIDNMTQGLLLFDGSARIIVCNQRYISMFGLSADLVKPGCRFYDLIQHRKNTGSFAGEVDDYCAAVLADIAKGKITEASATTVDGRSIQIVNKPLTDGGWVATYEDVTERKRANERIAYLAHHDALTDLPNRVRFREELEQLLKWVRRGERLAVLYLDLDDFKNINDTLGHPAGDELLKGVAARLRACVRETDVVARLGGDEFAVIQTALVSSADTTDLVSRIQRVLTVPLEVDHHQLITDVSIGIALAPDDGDNPDQLVRNADLALYAAKAEGRGTYCFFEPSMDARIKARCALEVDLRQAITHGAFELHYQPLFDLRHDRISGCEALLRWRHPDRGMIFPAEFIPLAEKTGLINELGAWVLRTACVEAATWPNDVKVAVNVSPVQFKSKGLALTVTGALEAANLPAHRLELEITESVLIDDDQVALTILNQLRELGVRIALDDFGTGYSSLSYLQRFHFDKIKIDRSFISRVAEKNDSLPIVQAVIDIAKSCNITTTAEGVETDQQLECLRTLGCTEVQGYLFSPPVVSTKIFQMISSTQKSLAIAS
jgi:diguanylate cyclase (GGDEF)-like protein